MTDYALIIDDEASTEFRIIALAVTDDDSARAAAYAHIAANPSTLGIVVLKRSIEIAIITR